MGIVSRNDNISRFYTGIRSSDPFDVRQIYGVLGDTEESQIIIATSSFEYVCGDGVNRAYGLVA